MEVDASSIVVGTCEDMCPAKERIKRQEESDVHQLELPQNGQTLQQTMIKKFQRSSADHELQIADAMRTPAALLRTIQYIENHIMIDDDDPLRTYLFIWDRYRMIAKDFTLQASVLPATRTWIECHERMVRWFVFMDHAMQVNAEFLIGHAQQNSERLNDFLKSLGHYYESQTLPDSARKNQAEFLSYFMLLQIGNGGEVARHMYRLPSHLLESPHLTFVMHVWTAIRTKNFMRFFQLLSEANVLQASLMHRYLGDIRLTAIQSLGRACSIGAKAARIALTDIADTLFFESLEETVVFLQHCGYSVDEDEEEVSLDGHSPLSSFPHDKNDLPIYPTVPPLVNRIGSKARDFTVQEICRGAATVDGSTFSSDLDHDDDDDAEMDDLDNGTVPLKTFANTSKTVAKATISKPSFSTPKPIVVERSFASPSPTAPSPRPTFAPPAKTSSAAAVVAGTPNNVVVLGMTESEKRKALMSRPLVSDRSGPMNNNNSPEPISSSSSALQDSSRVEKKKGPGVLAARLAKSKQEKQQQQQQPPPESSTDDDPSALPPAQVLKLRHNAATPADPFHKPSSLDASAVDSAGTNPFKKANTTPLKNPFAASFTAAETHKHGTFASAASPATAAAATTTGTFMFGAPHAAASTKSAHPATVTGAGVGSNVGGAKQTVLSADAKAFVPSSFVSFPPPPTSSSSSSSSFASSFSSTVAPAVATKTTGQPMLSLPLPSPTTTMSATAAPFATGSTKLAPRESSTSSISGGMKKTAADALPHSLATPRRMTSSDRSISLSLQQKQQQQAREQQLKEQHEQQLAAQRAAELARQEQEERQRQAAAFAAAEQEREQRRQRQLAEKAAAEATKREQEQRRAQRLAQCESSLQRQRLRNWWSRWLRLSGQRQFQRTSFAEGLKQLSVRGNNHREDGSHPVRPSRSPYRCYDDVPRHRVVADKYPLIEQQQPQQSQLHRKAEMTRGRFSGSASGSSLFDVAFATSPAATVPHVTLAQALSEPTIASFGGPVHQKPSVVARTVGDHPTRVFQLRLFTSSLPVATPVDAVLDDVRASLRNSTGWLHNFPDFTKPTEASLVATSTDKRRQQEQEQLAHLALHLYRSGIITKKSNDDSSNNNSSNNGNNNGEFLQLMLHSVASSTDQVYISVSEWDATTTKTTSRSVEADFFGMQLLVLSSLDLCSPSGTSSIRRFPVQFSRDMATPTTLSFLLHSTTLLSRRVASGDGGQVQALHLPHYPTPETLAHAWRACALASSLSAAEQRAVEQELFVLCHAFQHHCSGGEDDRGTLGALVEHTRHTVFVLLPASASPSGSDSPSPETSHDVSRAIASALYSSMTWDRPSSTTTNHVRASRNWRELWRDTRLCVIDVGDVLSEFLARALPSALADDEPEMVFTVATLARSVHHRLCDMLRRVVGTVRDRWHERFRRLSEEEEDASQERGDDADRLLLPMNQRRWLRALAPPPAFFVAHKSPPLFPGYADYYHRYRPGAPNVYPGQEIGRGGEEEGEEEEEVRRYGCVRSPDAHNARTLQTLEQWIFSSWLPSETAIDALSNALRVDSRQDTSCNWDAEVFEWPAFCWLQMLDHVLFPSLSSTIPPSVNERTEHDSLPTLSFTQLVAEAIVEPAIELLFTRGGVTTRFLHRHILAVLHRFLLRRLSHLFLANSPQPVGADAELRRIVFEPYRVSLRESQANARRPSAIQDHALLLWDVDTMSTDDDNYLPSSHRTELDRQEMAGMSKKRPFVQDAPFLLLSETETDHEADETGSYLDYTTKKVDHSTRNDTKRMKKAKLEGRHETSPLEGNPTALPQRELLDALQALLQKEKIRSQLVQDYLSKQILQG